MPTSAPNSMTAARLSRVHAMLNLLAARIAALIPEGWAAANRDPSVLHKEIAARLPGRGAGRPIHEWDIPLRVDVLRMQDIFATTEDQRRGLQYVLDAFNEWGRTAVADMTDEDFDRQFRRLIAAAEALGMDRELIAAFQVHLPGWAAPFAGGVGGLAGAAAAPFVVVGAVQGLGFGAGGILAGSTAASMMSQGVVGVPMMQSIGAAGLSVAGTGVAVVSGGLVVGGAVAGVAYGVKHHWENLARERVSRPTFNSTVLFNNTRVRLFSIHRQRYVTVVSEVGIPTCAEVKAPEGLEGEFIFGFAPNNLVWLRSAKNDCYLRNGMFQSPRLRFDGNAPNDYELFEMTYVARNRFTLKSNRVGGRLVTVNDDVGDDSVQCEGAPREPRCVFELIEM